MIQRLPRPVPIALFCLVVSLTGCQAFRADVGIGVGLGAEVRLPLLAHVGVGLGAFKYAGHNYNKGWQTGRLDDHWEQSQYLLLIFHASGHFERYFSSTSPAPDSSRLLVDVSDLEHLGYAQPIFPPFFGLLPPPPILDFNRDGIVEHRCILFLPFLLDKLQDRAITESCGLEVQAHLLFFSFRLGFNPCYLANRDEAKPDGPPTPEASVPAEE